MKKILAFIVLVMLGGKSFAQQPARLTEKEYARHPYWIAMMDDPDANYFETVKAYETYWKFHKKPLEEDEIIGTRGRKPEEAREKESWITRLFGQGNREEKQRYAFECKKFIYWQIKSAPYVQPDGRILNAQERLELWKSSR